MHYVKKILFSFLFFFLLVPFSLKAHQVGGLLYEFHVYYTNQELTADSDFTSPYDLVPDGHDATTGSAYGEIYSISGQKLADFQFTLKEGSNRIQAPYFSNGGKAILYAQSASVKPLAISLAQSAVCNENKTCEAAIGESEDNCSYDCGKPSASNPSAPAPSQTGEQGSNAKNIAFLIVLGILLLGAIGAGGYLFIRKKS